MKKSVSVGFFSIVLLVVVAGLVANFSGFNITGKSISVEGVWADVNNGQEGTLGCEAVCEAEGYVFDSSFKENDAYICKVGNGEKGYAIKDFARRVGIVKYYHSSDVDHYYQPATWNPLDPATGYTNEGLIGFMYDTQQPGTVALNRYYHAKDRDHLYVLATSTQPALSTGYKFESILGYIYSEPKEGTVALNRYYWNNGTNGNHLYVPETWDQPAISSGYSSEGVAGYIYSRDQPSGIYCTLPDNKCMGSSVDYMSSCLVKGCYCKNEIDTSTCSETDGGINYGVKGTVSLGPTSQTDSCLADGITLKEFSCSPSGSVIKEEKDCSELTGGEYECVAGRCVIKTTTPSSTGQQCIEDDNGKDYYVSGLATETYNGVVTADGMVSDYCLTPVYPNRLRESYCENGVVKQITFDCAGDDAVCSVDKCVKMQTGVCVDSDKGKHYGEAGITTDNIKGVEGAIIDKCEPQAVGETKLVEGYCENGVAKAEDLFCSDLGNYECVAGRCMSIPEKGHTCTDSDVNSQSEDGLNYAIAGNAVHRYEGIIQTNLSDRCSSSEPNVLLEGYCDGGFAKIENHNCADDGGSCDKERSICIGAEEITFGIEPTSVIVGEETTFRITGVQNVEKVIWKFETSAEDIETSGLETTYTYETAGEKSLQVTITKDGVDYEKIFTINVIEESDIDYDSIIALIGELEAKLTNVTTQINELDKWVGDKVTTELNISGLNATINDTRESITTSSTQEELLLVYDKLISLDIPSYIVIGTNTISSINDDLGYVDVSYIEEISKENVNDAKLKTAIKNWMKDNYKGNVSVEVVSAGYDEGEEAIVSVFDVDVKVIGDYTKEDYLIIDYPIGALTFAEDYGALSTGNGIYVVITDKYGMKFLVENEADAQDTGMYISPDVNAFDFNGGGCTFSSDCEDGQKCVNGNCVDNEDECADDVDCDDGYVCEYGNCVEEGNNGCAGDWECGDGYVCEYGVCVEKQKKGGEDKLLGLDKKIWIIILSVLIVVVLIIIGYLMYKRGGRSLFKREQDKANLIRFIRTAKKSGMNEAQIRGKLMRSGWTSAQIKYGLKKAK